MKKQVDAEKLFIVMFKKEAATITAIASKS